MSKIYFPPTIFPCFIGALFSEREYLKEMKRLGAKNPPPFITRGAAATMKTISKEGSSEVFIICIDLASARKNHTLNAILGLIAHEVSHVVDEVFNTCGEINPGKETKAYLTQWVTQRTLDAMDKWKKVR